MTSQLAVNISIFGLCNYAFQMTQQERDNKVSGNIWNLCNLLEEMKMLLLENKWSLNVK